MEHLLKETCGYKMDRKHCILLYSNYSPASLQLLTYIKGLPVDFPRVTGMTMTCVDHDQFRETLQKHGIEYVPTLLIEYYEGSTLNQTKQKFDHDYIYLWIDHVMNSLFPLREVSPDPPSNPSHSPEQRGLRRTKLPPANEPPQHVNEQEHIPQEDVPQIQKKEKVDITSLAQQMAKERDSYISETTPNHKK